MLVLCSLIKFIFRTNLCRRLFVPFTTIQLNFTVGENEYGIFSVAYTEVVHTIYNNSLESFEFFEQK